MTENIAPIVQIGGGRYGKHRKRRRGGRRGGATVELMDGLKSDWTGRQDYANALAPVTESAWSNLRRNRTISNGLAQHGWDRTAAVARMLGFGRKRMKGGRRTRVSFLVR